MQESSNKEYDDSIKKRRLFKKKGNEDKNPSFFKTFIWDLVFIAFCAFCAFYEFPYYIYTTGGSINLNERIKVSEGYDYSGSYSMNYVTVVKGKLPMLFLSLFKSDWDVVKEEKITVPNTSYEETLAIEKLELKNSLNLAKAIAFQNAGIKFNIINKKCTIYYVDEIADTTLEVLDELISYDDIEFTELSELQAYIASFEVGHEFTFEVKDKNGDIKTRRGKSILFEDTKIVGVSLLTSFDIESDIKVDIETKASEAGPSGGLLLTLAVYDAITEGDLTKGRTIMGTGTIETDGTVGKIGGVKYKMLGAAEDGADVFFVPADNYDEARKVYKEYELSFELVKVDTFADAIKYLEE